MDTMEEEQEIIGPWMRVKVLGYGGFGQVTLWYKSETEEYIAIKRPQEDELKGLVKKMQMDRWCKEVEIMKKLNHPNVVKALNIPVELEALSKAPMLAMEYCGLGDLRQVLNKPEHCCGLTEPNVIKILKDISSGLSYLHSCKVIHRDLKPDNIVLQCKDSVVMYKLIDLGYAKELDQNSVCKSFVGTVQYLAPELFLGKLYSSSVDYWSFGILAHEIITGYRPFLPGSNPPEWMKKVQNKQRNIISVIENINGDIIYSSTVSKVNQLSRCLLQDIEKWLQLALEWDGEDRGKDPITKKLIFFDLLNEILDKFILRIFSLTAYEILSYEIKPDTDLFTLKLWLERDTGISSDEQILLLRSGKFLESNGNVINCIKKEAIEPGSVSLFLYNIGPLKIRSRVVLKPLYVEELLTHPKKNLSYKHLKRSCSDSVFFLKSESNLLNCLIEAIRVKISNIRSRLRGVEALFEDVLNEWVQVEINGQFLIKSHKTDLENYILLRKEGVLKTSGLVKEWINNVMCAEKRISELMIQTNKKKGKLALEEIQGKCKSLENNEFLQASHQDFLANLLSEALKIWEIVQKIPKDNRIVLRSNAEILYRCISYTTKLLMSPLLDMLFQQFLEMEEHLTNLVSPLTMWLKNSKIMKQIIESTQRNRQKEIWSMIAQQKRENEKSLKTEKGDVKNRKEEEEEEAINDYNDSSPFQIPKTVHGEVFTPVDQELKLNFKPMKPVLVPQAASIQLSGDDVSENSLRLLESDSIISTTSFLRRRFEEINESWTFLLDEMKSINWDSLRES